MTVRNAVEKCPRKHVTRSVGIDCTDFIRFDLHEGIAIINQRAVGPQRNSKALRDLLQLFAGFPHGRSAGEDQGLLFITKQKINAGAHHFFHLF